MLKFFKRINYSGKMDDTKKNLTYYPEDLLKNYNTLQDR